MSANGYDAIVIGTGQGGHPLAKELANSGWKTAVVERGPVGGTCVNTGCTPTKTMVASARVAHLVSRAADYGVNISNFSIDLSKVRQRKRDIVHDFSSGSQKSLEKLDNIDLIFGTASFTAPKEIEVALNDVGSHTLTAPKIFINTGTRTAVPDSIEGLDAINYLTNASIMELDEVPEHLIVLGGGYIALEFSQMFRRFGSRVTVIERSARLLGREDEDVSEEIHKILSEDGIHIYFDTGVKRVSENGSQIEAEVNTPDGTEVLNGSHLLLATGQTPNSDMLNLEAAGVETDRRGFIKCNDKLETTAEGIYVIGDVKGGPAFTHISYDDFRVIRDNLLRGGSSSINGRLVPYTLFTDPELGRVGITENEAKSQGLNHKVAKIPMTWVARALETDETRGFMKAIVDADSGKILGCAILGIEGGEVMSVIQMAMMGDVPYAKIQEGVFAHPTLAESLNNLFLSMD